MCQVLKTMEYLDEDRGLSFNLTTNPMKTVHAIFCGAPICALLPNKRLVIKIKKLYFLIISLGSLSHPPVLAFILSLFPTQRERIAIKQTCLNRHLQFTLVPRHMCVASKMPPYNLAQLGSSFCRQPPNLRKGPPYCGVSTRVLPIVGWVPEQCGIVL